MSILKRLGHDTVARLIRASALRYDEACQLRAGGFSLGSIYLAGYSAEMVIGSAYFETIFDHGPRQKIVDLDLRTLLAGARQLSEMDDKSHPLDGLAALLIENKSSLNPPGFEERIRESLVEYVGIVAGNWGPKLRCRAIEATRHEADSVLKAVRWIIDHRPYR